MAWDNNRYRRNSLLKLRVEDADDQNVRVHWDLGIGRVRDGGQGSFLLPAFGRDRTRAESRRRQERRAQQTVERAVRKLDEARSRRLPRVLDVEAEVLCYGDPIKVSLTSDPFYSEPRR